MYLYDILHNVYIISYEYIGYASEDHNLSMLTDLMEILMDCYNDNGVHFSYNDNGVYFGVHQKIHFSYFLVVTSVKNHVKHYYTLL